MIGLIIGVSLRVVILSLFVVLVVRDSKRIRRASGPHPGGEPAPYDGGSATFGDDPTGGDI